jgi:hypothetical protein
MITPSVETTQLPALTSAEHLISFLQLREALINYLPEGFSEILADQALHYVVPLTLYPIGYHCNPNAPLPFITLVSQKNYIALHHLGLYADTDLLQWFKAEFTKVGKTKLDMGKSCIRFKKPEHIPISLMQELFAKLSPDSWITLYERSIKRF